MAEFIQGTKNAKGVFTEKAIEIAFQNVISVICNAESVSILASSH